MLRVWFVASSGAVPCLGLCLSPLARLADTPWPTPHRIIYTQRHGLTPTQKWTRAAGALLLCLCLYVSEGVGMCGVPV